MSSAADPIGPEPYAPAPLPWWGRLWRILACLLPSLALYGMTFATLDAQARADDQHYVGLLGADLLLVAPVLYIALWWHRRFPLWLSVLVALLGGVSIMAMGPSTLLLVSVATRRRWRQILPMSAAVVVAGFCFERVYPQGDGAPWWVNLAGYVVVTVAMVAWGMYIGARRELVAQWRWRAENAEVEQARQAVVAVQAERARIAREMHDVLAHRLSQVSLHAGVLSYRSDLTPEQVHAEAETIRATSTAALDDLRSILGVLRNDDGGVLAAPQPTSADLPSLIADARADGPVELVDETTARLPDALGRHTYRMVQESLTNARRHAPGAPVRVTLTGSPGGEVVLLVTNPRGGPSSGGGAGLGLVGLRERATIVGGTAQAGPAPDGGWVVEARLPWPRTEEDA